jgi:sugar-specific transcriptional regulator TrmB
MENLRPLLERIGFNHHESTIYLHLLTCGEAPASTIARGLKLPRSTVRGTLDKLCERSVVSKLYKRNTQHYFCKPAAALVAHMRETIENAERSSRELQDALPLLDALRDKRATVPKVRMFEGQTQVIEAFNRSLYQDIDEILIFTSYEFLKNPVIRRNDDHLFMRLRTKKGIRARVIVGRTADSEKMALNSPKELRERRLLPAEYTLPGNIHVYGDSVMYFSADEDEFMAVLVENKMMADTMRSLFTFLWNHCA